MTQRNRDHVRYIWFCIELERYNGRKCDSFDPRALRTSDGETELVLESFQSLFTALNTWEPNGSLTLGISLYSKSDNEHAFKYLTFMPDATGHQVELMSIAGSEEPDKHRWEKFTVSHILSHLPGLREFHYEIWMQWFTEMYESWHESLLELLSATEGLGKLTIFENSNQQYPLYFLGETWPAHAPTIHLS
ncbi:pranc domain [Trichoderma arundinaceum]|uniref:Pranc domain n=1 Tax=Trichoderma arundinaceum TaxID=490622 RepID=A0A395NK66_TRIAR|nr:pranc domain [Trichoderma arundinaceum]